jgi:hypothetical protein
MLGLMLALGLPQRTVRDVEVTTVVTDPTTRDLPDEPPGASTAPHRACRRGPAVRVTRKYGISNESGCYRSEATHDDANSRRPAVQEILDAILAENYDAIGGVDVPDHYRGVTVRGDEADMFAGLPARDKDPRPGPQHHTGQIRADHMIEQVMAL